MGIKTFGEICAAINVFINKLLCGKFTNVKKTA